MRCLFFCSKFVLPLILFSVSILNIHAQEEAVQALQPLADQSVVTHHDDFYTDVSCATPTCGSVDYGCSTRFIPSDATFYGQVDAVFWNLGNNRKSLILRDVLGVDRTVFDADDFDTTRGTPRVTLGVKLSDRYALEGAYNGFSGWKSSATILGNGDLSLPGSLGAFSNDFFYADRMDVFAKTSFHSAELNLVRKTKVPTLDVLVGFRYINFKDDMAIHSIPDVTVMSYASDYGVQARNDLAGGQLGLKWDRAISDRLGLQLTGKAGVYGNNARQRTWVGDDNNVTELRKVSMKRTKTSFVGELNLGGYYKITEGLSFIGGYNLIWVGDTARAADQFDFTHTTDSSKFVATDTLFMHGANVGLAWNF